MIEYFVNAKKNKPEWREEQMEVIKKVRTKTLAPFTLVTVIIEAICLFLSTY